MNDFTKEELYLIEKSVKHYFFRDCEMPLPHSPLHDKIQSLIDNYCEHENRHTDYENLVCPDCGKEW